MGKRMVSVDAIFVRSPLKFLNDAIVNQRHYEGVVVSVTYLERYGIDKLKKYFKTQGVPLEPMGLERLTFDKMTRMLEGFGIIDHHTHSQMNEVNVERNKIVQELRHPDALDKNEAEKTINKAISCLKALGIR
jgi:protein tyrosine phosphatase